MNKKCKPGCESHEVKLRGPRGFKGADGAQGPMGPEGPQGVPGQQGAPQAYKISFFEEVWNIPTDVITENPAFPQNSAYPGIWETLSFTNTTGSPKTFMVHGTAEGIDEPPDGPPPLQNYTDNPKSILEFSIIHTVAAGDLIPTYTNYFGHHFIAQSLMIPSTGELVPSLAGASDPWNFVQTVGDATHTPKNITSAYRSTQLVMTGAIMKKIVLQDGESVSLKFSAKGGSGSPSVIRSAQFAVIEVDP